MIGWLARHARVLLSVPQSAVRHPFVARGCFLPSSLALQASRTPYGCRFSGGVFVAGNSVCISQEFRGDKVLSSSVRRRSRPTWIRRSMSSSRLERESWSGGPPCRQRRVGDERGPPIRLVGSRIDRFPTRHPCAVTLLQQRNSGDPRLDAVRTWKSTSRELLLFGCKVSESGS